MIIDTRTGKGRALIIVALLPLFIAWVAVREAQQQKPQADTAAPAHRLATPARSDQLSPADSVAVCSDSAALIVHRRFLAWSDATHANVAAYVKRNTPDTAWLSYDRRSDSLAKIGDAITWWERQCGRASH